MKRLGTSNASSYEFLFPVATYTLLCSARRSARGAFLRGFKVLDKV